jgi:PAS domain S-box-containing protein
LHEHPEQTSFDQIALKSGRVFERYSQPQRIEDTIVGRVWSFRDITERKRAEERVRRSEAKYRNLLENIPQKIFYKDRNSVYAAVNPSYAKDLGVLPEDIVGKTDYDFFPDELADKYRTDDQRVMAQGATEELDESYSSGGEEKSVHTVKAPVYDENGTITGVLGIFWDITDRKRAEEKLQQAHDELEHRVAIRTKELLRANEALRSEITDRKRAEDTLRLLSSRLLTSQEVEQCRIAMELHDQTGQDIIFLKLQLQALKNQLRKNQNKLEKECDKILTFTNRIIEDVRRLAHGLSPSQLQTLGLRAALIALIQNFSENTHIPIRYDVEALDNGFRPETEIVLYRIFQEALTNIYKHSRAKTVWIDVRRRGNSLSISIRDDGKGFDTCQHGTSESTVEPGMGLSALELRSRMIGADLKISSQPGQGTEINLFMPIKGNSISR